MVGVALVMVLGMGTPSGSKTQAAPSARKKPLRPTDAQPYQVGKATWYGDRFHGRTTSSGEQFDMFAMTAAHPRLPLGTLVRVTNLLTRRSVVVRINDRGPADPRSILDLSYAAAESLGAIHPGRFPVRLELVEDSPTALAELTGSTVKPSEINQFPKDAL